MSAKMKAEARKKSTESASPSRGTAKIRRASISRRADDLPEAKENVSYDAHPDSSLGHDFADLSIEIKAYLSRADRRQFISGSEDRPVSKAKMNGVISSKHSSSKSNPELDPNP